jgi:hypothetical protein
MKDVLLVVAALLFSAAAYAAPEDAQAAPGCVMCRDELKKELEACKSQSAGDARDLCRAGARSKAEECAKHNGFCNVDLLMEPSPKSKS